MKIQTDRNTINSVIERGFAVSYIIAMLLMLTFYVFVMLNMGRVKNARLANLVAVAVIVACYLHVIIRVYVSVGAKEWNFLNTLPTANVSPFMFTLVAVSYLFPKRVRRHIYLLISLLSVGMIISPVLGCLYNASINYRFHLHFLSDYIAHVVLSLWGVYLVRSRQVELTKKNVLTSSGIIVGVALTMMILNVIFDTAFFGLSLNGKHNIYNNVLTESSYLSAALYFFGLVGVLVLGYLYVSLISRKTNVSGAENGNKQDRLETHELIHK